MATIEIEIIKQQSKALTDSQKSELIDFLKGQMHEKNGNSTPLKFGKYASSGRLMSTEEDFNVAE